ncbi:hypothetical protein Tco_1415485 [Tanacetum coccineum]
MEVEEVPKASLPVNHDAYPAGRGRVISKAYDLFQTFKRILVDLILTFEDKDNSQAYFHHLGYGEAFSTIEIELGFAYDMLYTKAYVHYLVTKVVFLFERTIVTLFDGGPSIEERADLPVTTPIEEKNEADATAYTHLSDEDHTGINVCRVESKHLSEYMLHLLVECPVMLPIGIGMIRYRGTCADAMRFFKVEGPINGKEEACHKLLHVDCTEVLPHEVKEDRGLNLHYLTVADSCQV